MNSFVTLKMPFYLYLQHNDIQTDGNGHLNLNYTES